MLGTAIASRQVVVGIYARGKDEAPLVAECKARKNGSGFATLERWVGDYDILFLKRNNREPMVMLP